MISFEGNDIGNGYTVQQSARLLVSTIQKYLNCVVQMVGIGT
jgi:hypothetical protein